MDLKKFGKKIDNIPVTISYKIIELFSGGLYSSPNKAFEELISNSYDANANKVGIHISDNLENKDAYIWVIDNGISMGRDGLKDFWKIGESNKIGDRKIGKRYQIGKFGIGKLATYVLTNELTYVCKFDNEYFMVTMDYKDINKDTDQIILDEKKLSENEALSIVNNYCTINNTSYIPFNIDGKHSEDTWTFSLLTNLKEKATEISEGRLKWILSTALPLNPEFNLFYNNEEIHSSKEEQSPLKTWVAGKDDTIVKKHSKLYSSGINKKEYFINLPTLKEIYGKFELYADSLVRGKSQDWGRSNGVFLMVRERLINLDDPLLGMPTLTLGVFNRIRIIIKADGLDKYLTSTRESIKESKELKELRDYIQKKFNEIKKYYFEFIESTQRTELATYKISNTPSSLSRRPIIIATKKYFNDEIEDLLLTKFPENLNSKEQKKFLSGLEFDLTSQDGIIQSVKLENLDSGDFIAHLNVEKREAIINIMHPFFANFIEDVKNKLPFELIALTEILTELNLVEQGIREDDIKRIMINRDKLLREFTYNEKQNAPTVASIIKATLNNPEGLEDAVYKAFLTLGFETIKIGKKGKPDGRANAYLESKNSPKNYSLTYDAKSTSKEKIKAHTSNIVGVLRHKEAYNADFAVIVAIDFEGANDKNSAINTEAKRHKVNLIKAKDLITLILIAAPKQINLFELKNFFQNCHTVLETSEWINNQKSTEIKIAPIKEIVNTAFDLIKNDTERPTISALRKELQHKYSKFKNISIKELEDIFNSLKILVPNYISLDNDIISLQNSPDIIISLINQLSSSNIIPYEFREIYLKAFSN